MTVGNSWDPWLKSEIEKNYFERLIKDVKKDEKKTIVYPKETERFRAFEETPFDKVKVVIFMDGPYNRPLCADGLALSSMYNETIELRNVFLKIESELGVKCKDNFDLARWARQGVFLLNTNLTTNSSATGHQKLGWWKFTLGAIAELLNDSSPKCFLIFGKQAHALYQLYLKDKFINNHLILFGNPTNKDFYSQSYFKRVNDFLESTGQSPIDWR